MYLSQRNGIFLDLSVLQDLKQLLLEAGQELPAFLRELTGEEGTASSGDNADKVRSKAIYLENNYRDVLIAPDWATELPIAPNWPV